jgi:ribonuclease VapC
MVMDSSAILAVLLNEPGGHSIQHDLPGALVSSVNLSEVYARLLKRGVPKDLAWAQILASRLEVCLLTAEQARAAAELIQATRARGLSLGDRACIALAIERKAKVYTADREWASLGLGIEIEVIR